MPRLDAVLKREDSPARLYGHFEYGHENNVGNNALTRVVVTGRGYSGDFAISDASVAMILKGKREEKTDALDWGELFSVEHCEGVRRLSGNSAAWGSLCTGATGDVQRWREGYHQIHDLHGEWEAKINDPLARHNGIEGYQAAITGGVVTDASANHPYYLWLDTDIGDNPAVFDLIKTCFSSPPHRMQFKLDSNVQSDLEWLPNSYTAWIPSVARSLIVHAGQRVNQGMGVETAHNVDVREPEQSPASLLNRLRVINAGWAERIDQLRKLEVNWDGYDAVTISDIAVKKCCKVLVATEWSSNPLVHEAFIAPLADGGLEIEWEFPEGNELMIVFPPEESPVQFLLTTFDKDGQESEREGTIPVDSTVEKLIVEASA